MKNSYFTLWIKPSGPCKQKLLRLNHKKEEEIVCFDMKKYEIDF